MSPEEIWQTVLGEMELSISKANFTTWFRGTRILEQDDRNIVIAVPNNFSKEWLHNKYNPQISQIIKKSLPDLQKIDYRVSTGVLHSIADTKPNENDQTPKAAHQTDLTKLNPQNSTFNAKYTFDNFVVGSNNRLAHATSVAICEKPGETYNPLFIYGGVGLGKTHLIHAIGNEIQKRHPGKTVLYVTCENFTNDFIHSISAGKTNDFKKRYRNVDVLLVDDIQFLSHKEGTQEEFFHTFNALHQTNRQIVITSDRVHTSIPDLEVRLSSRFGWGMVADVRTPNLETRLAILQTKCQEKNFTLPEEMIESVAQQITSNIRELEGALTRIITHCSLYKVAPSLDIINELLEDVLQNKNNKKVTTDQILKTITKFFNISLDELTGKKRTRELVYPRQIAMYLLKNELNLSFPAIGRELGGKDHTTIIHGAKKIKKEAASNKTVQQDIISVKEIIYG
ncbi:MAG: chromosomal replication initiator protein DnaA [bacterium]|nr:chromosomal replication initiator protein DnaA [bacterium]